MFIIRYLLNKAKDLFFLFLKLKDVIINPMNKNTIETIFFLALVAVGFVLLFLIFKPYLAIIFVAIIFAIIFMPVKVFLDKKLKIKNTASSFLTVLIVFVVVLTPLFILGTMLFQEATTLAVRLPESGIITQYLESRLLLLENYINSIAPDAQVNLSLHTYIEGTASWIVSNFSSLFSSIAKGTINIFLMIIALFFFLKDGNEIEKTLLKWSPLGNKHDKKILKKMTIAINSVVKGTLFIAMIQGILAGIGFVLFGVPSPVLWGFITVLSSLLPGIGTAIVLIPLVIYLYLSSGIMFAIGLLAWGLLIVGLIDNILRPILIEKDVKIHPLLILLSVFGGISFFGPIGFLVGPIVLSFVFALVELYPSIMNHDEECVSGKAKK